MSRLKVAAWSALGVLAWASATQAAPCTIATRTLDPDLIYPTAHACRPCPASRAAAVVTLCDAIDRIMVPNMSVNADLAVIPHRGLWGGRTGPDAAAASENTLAAFQAALAAGYRAVEIDIAKGSDGIFVGHYFTMKAAGGGDTNPNTMTLAQITAYKMNKRDGRLSADVNERLPSLVDVITWAKANQVLLMLDPKVKSSSMTAEYNEIVAKALKVASDAGALPYVVIKTTESYAATKTAIDTEFGGVTQGNAILGKFLWSPIVNKSATVTQADTLAAMTAWNAATESSKGVIMYEVGIMTPAHWSNQTITSGGVNYTNLIDYTNKMGPASYRKRAAIWSIDPMTDKGTMGSTYNYKFIGNDATEKRGDVVQSLIYAGAMYSAVTTDRPDFYKSVASSPYW